MGASNDVIAHTDRRSWTARGVVTSAGSTFIALMSHLVAGGEMPGPLGVILPLLLAMATCSVLAGVRLAWPRLVLSVAISQVLFHTLFVLGSATSTAAPAAPLAGTAGHLHHQGTELAVATDASAHLVHASGSMWLAHVGAGLLTVLALRRGEAALTLRNLLGRVVHRVVRSVTVVIPVRPHGPAAPIQDERAWVPVARALISTCVVRRGPPRSVVLALR